MYSLKIYFITRWSHLKRHIYFLIPWPRLHKLAKQRAYFKTKESLLVPSERIKLRLEELGL